MIRRSILKSIVDAWCTATRALCVFALAATLHVSPANASDPPPPNSENPVDYVAWLNREYGAGIKENAAPRYETAIAAFVENEAALKIIKQPTGSGWTPDDRRTITEWIKQNERCLDEYAAAAQIRECFFECESPDGLVTNVVFPRAVPVRHIARLLAARAKMRLNEAEIVGAIQDVQTLLRAARHMETQPFVIQYLRSLAIRALTYDVLSDIPGRAGETIDYAAVLKAIRRPDRPVNIRGSRLLLTERISAWDVAQRFPSPPPMTLAENVKQIEAIHERLARIFTAPYATAKPLGEELERELKAKKSTVVGLMLSSLTRVSVLARRTRAEQAAVRSLLRIHKYQAEHGEWPKTLREAMKSEASVYRKDPFTGKDLIYRVGADRRPILYSVGENGVDDGGTRPANGKRWADDGDAVFWPR